MEEKRKNHIIHQLKGKSFSQDLMIEIKSNAREVFLMLLERLEDGTFNKYQKVHSLYILFELCSREMLGNQDKLLEQCTKNLESSEDIFVSSASLELLVRMLITNKKSPDHYPLKGDILGRARGIIENIDRYDVDEKSKKYAINCKEKHGFG